MLKRIVTCYRKLVLQISNEILDRIFAVWIHARIHASLCARLVARIVIFYVCHHTFGETFTLMQAVRLARQRASLHTLDPFELHQRCSLQFLLLLCFFLLGGLLLFCLGLLLGTNVPNRRYCAVLAREPVHTLAD